MKENAKVTEIKVVHEGRGGYVEVEGCRYPIALEDGGRFTIFFSGRGHQASHLPLLEQFCQAQNPPWAVEQRKRSQSDVS